MCILCLNLSQDESQTSIIKTVVVSYLQHFWAGFQRAHSSTIHPSKTYDNVVSIIWHYFKEVPLIHNIYDHSQHVIC